MLARLIHNSGYISDADVPEEPIPPIIRLIQKPPREQKRDFVLAEDISLTSGLPVYIEKSS